MLTWNNLIKQDQQYITILKYQTCSNNIANSIDTTKRTYNTDKKLNWLKNNHNTLFRYLQY